MTRQSCRASQGVPVPLAIAVILCACADSTDCPETAVVRDSAGIAIVENSAPVLPRNSWSVLREPSLDIGGDENDEMQNLYQVAGSVQLSDGRIVIAHSPPPMLRWYGPDGRFLTGTGRPGGGPGEFGTGESAWISTLWSMEGDSISTWEHSARRMQVFDPQGRFGRSIVLDLPPDMPVQTYPQIAGRSNVGFIAFLVPSSGLGPLGSTKRDALIYLAYGPDGSFSRRFGRIPGLRDVHHGS